jgi:hypothetical protein
MGGREYLKCIGLGRKEDRGGLYGKERSEEGEGDDWIVEVY